MSAPPRRIPGRPQKQSRESYEGEPQPFSVHLPQTAVQIDEQLVLVAELIISLKSRAF